LFRIAESTGKSVEEVLHTMTTLELAGWAKYYGYLHQQSKRKT